MYHYSLTTLTNLMTLGRFERVAGDEIVRSVFRRSGSAEAPGYTNDREDVLLALHEAERRLGQLNPRALLRSTIRRSGLLPLARRVTQRLGL